MSFSLRPIILLCSSLYIFHPALIAQSPSPPELVRIPYTSHNQNEQKNFFLYLPAGYHTQTADHQWPVLLFLHGNGERGNGREDLDWVLREGPLYEAWIQ